MYIRNRILIENADLPDIIRKKLDECVESYFNLDKLCENMNYSKNYIINVFKNKYKSDGSNPWHKLWIVFTGDFANSLINCYLPEDTYLFRGCEAVKKYFEEIVEISRQDIPYDLMVNKITINLMHIFMYIRNRILTENADLPDIIRKKLDECVESYYNLDRLCESMNYSKNYIINVFKGKYNITPYQYYLDKKIDAAKTYLTHTNVSIGTISKTLHYADQQYFSSSFKKTVGCSPVEYRRKTRKE